MDRSGVVRSSRFGSFSDERAISLHCIFYFSDGPKPMQKVSSPPLSELFSWKSFKFSADMVTRTTSFLLCALLLAGPAFAGEDGSPAAEAGHAVKETGKAIGHGARDAAKAVGHGTRSVTTAIGHGFRDAAKAIGHGTRDTVHAVGGADSKDIK
jgi:hypothetical protein